MSQTTRIKVANDTPTTIDLLLQVEVVSAGATLLGVILAGFGGFVAYKLFKVESERDIQTEARAKRADALVRRQQASAIGFWHTEDHTWRVANLSSLPIYRVAVCRFIGRHDIAWYRPVAEEAMSPGLIHSALSPEQSLDFALSEKTESLVSPRERESETVLLFVDNSGITWARRKSRLTELSQTSNAENPLMVELLKSLVLPEEAGEWP